MREGQRSTLRRSGRNARMHTFIYMLTLWCIGGTLILIVDKFEPDRQFAFVLEFVVVALGVTAIARRLLS
jgi:hypothetical protein